MCYNQTIDLKWSISFIKITNCLGEPKFDICVEQFLVWLYLPHTQILNYQKSTPLGIRRKKIVNISLFMRMKRKLSI